MANKRKKRRRRSDGKKKKGGMLTGMRSGFKNIASTGGNQQNKKKSGWMGTAITIALLLAAIALFFNSR